MTDANDNLDSGDLDNVYKIDQLVRRFYGSAAQDELLGPVFNEVARVDWAEHIPKLVAFWSRTLLGIEGYSGNPFQQHAAVHRREPFTAAHFDRWLELFHETIDDEWVGPHAERAKDVADNVGRVHQSQLLGRGIRLDGGRSLS